VAIQVRSDLGNDLAADVAVGQPVQACQDFLPGDHLDRRQKGLDRPDAVRRAFRMMCIGIVLETF
jgi:hypothetical protein